MYKVYSKILHAQLLQWLKAYDILLESQPGFWSGYSFITATITPLKEVQTEVDASRPFFICFVDFRQAFHFVNRAIRFTELHVLGTLNYFFNVLYQCVLNNTVFIRINQSNCPKRWVYLKVIDWHHYFSQISLATYTYFQVKSFSRF